jgi:hypothetical protein
MKHLCLDRIAAVLLCFCVVLYADAQSSKESRFISLVSQHRLQKTVRDLVHIGNRMGGTRSGDRATRYLVKKFKSYGYNAALITDPEKLAFTNIDWHCSVDRPKKFKGLIQHEWLACFSPSAPLRISKLTFVKSIGDIDKDRIDSGAVLLDQHPSFKMYDDLADAGARCILCYQASNRYTYATFPMIMSLRETDKNPIPVFNISNLAGENLREEIEKGTTVTVKYSSKTLVAKGNPKTVVATLAGRTDSCFILCAHGDADSGGPGADDNASGDAAVLEVARVLKTMVRLHTLRPPRKTIKFIIWGSEYFSSSSYVKQHGKELGKILGVINYDEVGIGKIRRCLYFEGNDLSQNRSILRLFEGIGEEFAGRKGFWKEATTNPSQGGTDSYVFLPDYLSRLDEPDIKIPSITVYTAAWNEPKSMEQTRGWTSKAWKGNPDSVIIDYSPFYHSSLDIPALTTDKEPSRMVWATDAVGIAFLRMLWD